MGPARGWWLLTGWLLARPPFVYAQATRSPSPQELADLIQRQQQIIEQQQQQIDRLLQQVEELKQRFEQSHPQVPAQPSHAQRDTTRLGYALRWYGYLRADVDIDSSRMFLDAQLPFWVRSPDDPSQDAERSGDFTIHPRLSRVGFDLIPPTFADWQPSAKLETDFYNAFITGGRDLTSRSRAALRVRLAYAQLKRGPLTIRAGQDWETISPLLPHLNTETLMWDAGNTGARRPQVKLIYQPPAPKGQWSLEGSLGAGGTVDDRDRDGDGFRDSETSREPVLQARAAYSAPSSVNGQRWTLGIWAHHAQTRLNKRLDPPQNFGGHRQFSSNVAGADFTMPLTPTLSLLGEAWTGANLSDVRGGVGQCVNSTTGEEVNASGGWLELRYLPDPHHQLHLGISLDNPKDSEVSANGRTRNQVLYLTDWFRITKSLTLGLEISRWSTDFLGMRTGKNTRTSIFLQQDF